MRPSRSTRASSSAQPRDWNSANALGDLFVRSAQLDKGVEQYTRIADHLAEEGFYPKASALYKKILKVKPTEEYALIRSGDVAAKLGLLADAKSAYQTVAERRRKLGNVRGAAEMAVRLGTVDPEDFDARYAAAKAAREVGDTETALRELRAAALGFEEKARHEEARSAYRDILELEPDDEDARARVLAANIATGEFTSAFALATSPDELRQLAAALEARRAAGRRAGGLGSRRRSQSVRRRGARPRGPRPPRRRRHGLGPPPPRRPTSPGSTTRCG